MTDLSWMDRAVCREVGTVVFFPDAAEPREIVADVAHAKNICMGCPVIDECLEFGLYENYGIWGGTTRMERRAIRKRRDRARHAAANVVSLPPTNW